MKKIAVILSFFGMLALGTFAQTGPYKIVFQLASADTMVHKSLMKQIGNMTSVEPGTKIEVVCHGPGLNMLVKEKTVVANKIAEYTAKGVVFDACEFSMKERKVAQEAVLETTTFVKAGILHIVQRQAEGWYYIKAGF